MNSKNYDEIMRDEIKMRMESDVWNYRIASGVFEKKRRSRKLVILSSSISSLAAAALVLVIILFGIDKPPVAQYEEFLTKQIEGTYNDVFNTETRRKTAYGDYHPISNQIIGTYNDVFDKSVQLTKNDAVNVEILMASEIDSVIDEALTMR